MLSGGEKARLVLCKLLLQRPNFLLLDEPTNHLDISSRVVLEKALGDFPGSICFISHDRQFINGVANKILLAKSGKIHIFPGNYDDYQRIWKTRLDGPPQDPANGKPEGNGPGAKTRTSQKRAEAELRNELFRVRKPIQDRIESIEAGARFLPHRTGSPQRAARRHRDLPAGKTGRGDSISIPGGAGQEPGADPPMGRKSPGAGRDRGKLSEGKGAAGFGRLGARRLKDAEWISTGLWFSVRL